MAEIFLFSVLAAKVALIRPHDSDDESVNSDCLIDKAKSAVVRKLSKSQNDSPDDTDSSFSATRFQQNEAFAELQKKLEEEQGAITAAEKEISGIIEMIATVETENRRAKRSNRELKRELTATQGKVHSLETELEATSNQLRSMTCKFYEKSTANDALEARLFAMESMSGETTTSSGSSSGGSSSGGSSGSRLEDMEVQLQHFEGPVQLLTRQLQAEHVANSTLRHDLETVEQLLLNSDTEHAAELSAAQAIVSDLEYRLNVMEDNLSAAETANVALKAQMRADAHRAASSQDSSTAECRRLEQEHQRLQAQISTINAELASQRRHSEDIQQQLKAAEAAAAAVTAAAQEQERNHGDDKRRQAELAACAAQASKLEVDLGSALRQLGDALQREEARVEELTLAMDHHYAAEAAVDVAGRQLRDRNVELEKLHKLEEQLVKLLKAAGDDHLMLERHKQQQEQLRAELSQEQDKCASLNDNLHSLRSRLKEQEQLLEQARSQSRKATAEATEETTTLKAELQRQQKLITDLNKKLDSKSAQSSPLRTAVSAFAAASDKSAAAATQGPRELEQELHACKVKGFELENELGKSRNEISSLSAQLEAKQISEANLQRELADAQSEIDSLSQQQRDYEGIIAELIAKARSAADALTVARADADAAQDAGEEIEPVRNELSAAKAQLQRLASTEDELSAAKAQLQRLASTEDELSAAKAQLKRLASTEDELSAAKAQLAVTKAELATSSNTLQTTTAQLIKTKAELATSNNKRCSDENKLQSTIDELAATNGELSLCKLELASTQEELSTIKQELVSTKEQLYSTRNDLVKTREALEQAAQGSRAELKRKDSQMSKLISKSATQNGALEEARRELDALQQGHDDAVQALRVVREEMEFLRSEKQQLLVELAAKEAVLEKTSTELTYRVQERSELQEVLQEKEEELARTTGSLKTETSSQLYAQEAALTRAETRLKQQQAAVAAAEARCSAAEARCSAAEELLAASKDDLTEATQRLREGDVSVQNLQKDLLHAEERASGLEREISAMQDELQELKSEARTKEQGLTQPLAAHEQGRLAEELAAVQYENTELNETLKESQSKVSQLEEQLQELHTVVHSQQQLETVAAARAATLQASDNAAVERRQLRSFSDKEVLCEKPQVAAAMSAVAGDVVAAVGDDEGGDDGTVKGAVQLDFILTDAPASAAAES